MSADSELAVGGALPADHNLGGVAHSPTASMMATMPSYLV